MNPRSKHAIAALVRALNESGAVHSLADIEERFSSGTLTAAVRRGDVVRMGPALYADRESSTTMACRLSLARAWLPDGGAVAGRAALWCWGWRDDEPDTIHAVVPRGVRHPAPPALTLLRTDAKVTRHVLNGVPVVDRAHALIYAWRWDSPQLRTGRALDAFRNDAARPADVLKALPSHPRIPERAQLQEVCRLASSGVTSMLEYIARTEVFVGEEWDEWQWQGVVRAGHRTCVVDMLQADARVAVEFDGAKYHADDARRRRDLERDAVMAAAGFVTVRLTWEDLVQRPGWCVARVREVLAQRVPLATGNFGT